MPHEHRAAIGGHDQHRPVTSRPRGPVREALDAARDRVASQHLVGCQCRRKWPSLLVVAVGLDSDQAGGVDDHPVGRVEQVARVDVGRPRLRAFGQAVGLPAMT